MLISDASKKKNSVSSLSALSSDSSWGPLDSFYQTQPVSPSDGSIKLSPISIKYAVIIGGFIILKSLTDAHRDVVGVKLVDVARAAFLWDWERKSGMGWICAQSS